MRNKVIAESGIISALILVILFLAGIVPVNNLSLSAVSAFLLNLYVERNGLKRGIMVYGVVSVLSLILLPLKSIGVLFITIYGGYVIIRKWVVFRKESLAFITRVLLMDGLLLTLYGFANLLLEDILPGIEQLALWQIIGIFCVIQMVIGLYDYALTLGTRIIDRYLRKTGI